MMMMMNVVSVVDVIVTCFVIETVEWVNGISLYNFLFGCIKLD